MHNDMRFNVIHTRMDTVVGTLEHIDTALAFLRDPESKDFHIIDRWTGVEIDRPEVRASRIGTLNADELPFHTIDQLIMGGQKILSIKLIRELTGLGLGESKAIADRRQVVGNSGY
jgi:hypothetical protein